MNRRVPAESRDEDSVGELSGEDWFIADLHLTDQADPLSEHFLRWLPRVPTEARLWILGDLFEYWLGKVHLESEGFAPVLDALQARSEAGGFTAVVPGNRDFLLGAAFTQRTGVSLVPDGIRLQRGGQGWLLLHGDELCTRDRGYQRLRRVLRARPVQALLRRLPAGRQHAVARRLRRASQRAVPQKAPERVAMQADEAEARLEANGAQRLLCGHAHQFVERSLGHEGRWWVLDAFGAGSHDVLRLGPGDLLRWEGSREALGGDPDQGAWPL